MAAFTWGDLIRDLRIKHGVSQRSLADKAGVNRTFLRALEQQGDPSEITMLEKLLTSLGYDLDAILIGEPDENLSRRGRSSLA